MNYDDFIKRIHDCYPEENKLKQKKGFKQEKEKTESEKDISDSRSSRQQFADTNG